LADASIDGSRHNPDMSKTASSKTASRPPHDPCPCGRPLDYADCCGRWHRGEAAPDAESLMRSRYSAYVRRDVDYLLASWHASTRPAELTLDESAGGRTTWLGLSVQKAIDTGADTAEVEFLARYRIGGAAAVRMVEHSRFVREGGHWYYLDAR
jgi:SEC-C motif-containing protein